MPTATINIPRHKFTQAYWKIAAIKSRYRVVRGGSSAGKSFAIAQDEILHALRQKETTLVVRKFRSTIEDSVYKSFKERLDEFGLRGRYTATKSPFKISLPNGSLFIFTGLDDPEKIKSIDGISRIFIEEATELDETDFDELDRRLRAGKNPQISLAFNPIDEGHWLKGYFFDREVEDSETLVLTYLDNDKATEKEKAVIARYKAKSPYQYMVYGLGDWGQIKNGSEFYPAFDIQFVEDTPFMPELQHTITGWDFNVTPYMTCICCQIRYVDRFIDPVSKKVSKTPSIGALPLKDVLQFRFYQEYTFENPKNSVEAIAEQFNADHVDYLDTYGLTLDVYGDAQGFNRVEGLGNERRFDWIIYSDFLRPFLHNSSLKAKNPNVAPIRRRDFINAVFAGDVPEVEIVIDPSCKELIDDFKHCKQGTKEGKLFKVKKRVKNKATGETYEEHGHTSDACENIICEVCRDMIKKG